MVVGNLTLDLVLVGGCGLGLEVGFLVVAKLEVIGVAWMDEVNVGLDEYSVVVLEGCDVVSVGGGCVDLYLMSVTANLALLASMGALGLTGRVMVVVVGEVDGVIVLAVCVVVVVAVSISSSDSVVVSSRPAMVSGSSSGALIQNSQLSSNTDMESILSSVMVGVIVAVGSVLVLVECSGKVRRPLVP